MSGCGLALPGFWWMRTSRVPHGVSLRWHGGSHSPTPQGPDPTISGFGIHQWILWKRLAADINKQTSNGMMSHKETVYYPISVYRVEGDLVIGFIGNRMSISRCTFSLIVASSVSHYVFPRGKCRINK